MERVHVTEVDPSDAGAAALGLNRSVFFDVLIFVVNLAAVAWQRSSRAHSILFNMHVLYCYKYDTYIVYYTLYIVDLCILDVYICIINVRIVTYLAAVAVQPSSLSRSLMVMLCY